MATKVPPKRVSARKRTRAAAAGKATKRVSAPKRRKLGPARKSKGSPHIGLIGLATMGPALALNFADHGCSVIGWDYDSALTRRFQNRLRPDSHVHLVFQLSELVRLLPRPRTILLMIKAGPPVDSVLSQLYALLDSGDIIVEGGNSDFQDTDRREQEAAQRGMLFVGCGVSGGEKGARTGPSLMPGGNPDAWPRIRPLLEAIAARGADGKPCCTWIGRGGAGHFTKMVHNGIEYAVMELIAEIYDLLRRGLKMDPTEIADVFEKWNRTRKSFLLELSAKILRLRDPEKGGPMIDLIQDMSGQKGTGVKTILAALNMGVSASIIGSAVAIRLMSTRRGERETIHDLLKLERPALKVASRPKFISMLADALDAATLITYTQGFRQMQAASLEFGWNLPLSDIARIWTGGCIIRSGCLMTIAEAFAAQPGLPHLLMAQSIREEILKGEDSLAEVISAAVRARIPNFTLSAAHSYLLTMQDTDSPMSVIAALRDGFGAHGYYRVDRVNSGSGTLYHLPSLDGMVA